MRDVLFFSVFIFYFRQYDGHLLGKDSPGFFGQDKIRATVSAKLLRTLRFSATYMSVPLHLIEQPACVIYFREQAGSATVEPLYRLSSVRNGLHIAEFFEPIFAEFNANP
jgi:hypothetical protein